MGWASVLGISCPPLGLLSALFLPALCCRTQPHGVHSSSLAFWLLVGFGHGEALQERRGREERGLRDFISLLPLLWHCCCLSLSKGHCPSHDSLLSTALSLCILWTMPPTPSELGQSWPVVTGPGFLLYSWWFLYPANTFIKNLLSSTHLKWSNLNLCLFPPVTLNKGHLFQPPHFDRGGNSGSNFPKVAQYGKLGLKVKKPMMNI